MKNMRLTLFLSIFALLFMSCQTEPREYDNFGEIVAKKYAPFILPQDSSNHTKNKAIRENESTENENAVVEQAGDSTVKMLSYLIAGKAIAGSFPEIEQKSYYKEHQQITEKGWSLNSKENLSKIQQWIGDNDISSPDETQALYYPFAGPDFLYANAFFPYASTYILVGLEQPGTLFHPDSINEDSLKVYLGRVRHALRYVDKAGYFVTKHMQTDLSQTNLNGVIHLILYYIARTNHHLIDAYPVHLEPNGKIAKGERQNKKQAPGYYVKFSKIKGGAFQELYYFRYNLSDFGLRTRPGLTQFLDQYEDFATYIKSGSYILHNDEFSQMRNYILTNSHKILQDDSGIPFKYLKNKFGMELFGQYTTTTQTFSYGFQSDLKTAAQNNPEKGKLPFEITYNQWHGETILMYGEKNRPHASYISAESLADNTEPEHKTVVYDGSIRFKVQILSTHLRLEKTNALFKGLSVDMYHFENAYKYTLGNEASLESCRQIQKSARAKGFSDAFIVAFEGEKRIPLQLAIQKLMK